MDSNSVQSGFIDSTNRSYREIWKRYWNLFHEITRESPCLDYFPLQYPPKKIRTNSLLFIGFNPSLNEKDKNVKDLLKIDDVNDLDDPKKIEKIINLEEKVLSEEDPNESDDPGLYSYYRQFPKIAKDVTGESIKWSHIDVLPIRNKKQNEVKDNLGLDRDNLFYLSEIRCDELKESSYPNNDVKAKFISDLIELFFKTISYIEPLAIIIVNGYVSKSIMQITGSKTESVSKSLNKRGRVEACLIPEGYKFELDENKFYEFGVRLLNANGKAYPVFLSSMLTGQRTLDLSSRERLVLDMKRYFDVTKRNSLE